MPQGPEKSEVKVACEAGQYIWGRMGKTLNQIEFLWLDCTEGQWTPRQTYDEWLIGPNAFLLPGCSERY